MDEPVDENTANQPVQNLETGVSNVENDDQDNIQPLEVEEPNQDEIQVVNNEMEDEVIEEIGDEVETHDSAANPTELATETTQELPEKSGSNPVIDITDDNNMASQNLEENEKDDTYLEDKLLEDLKKEIAADIMGVSSPKLSKTEESEASVPSLTSAESNKSLSSSNSSNQNIKNSIKRQSSRRRSLLPQDIPSIPAITDESLQSEFASNPSKLTDEEALKSSSSYFDNLQATNLQYFGSSSNSRRSSFSESRKSLTESRRGSVVSNTTRRLSIVSFNANSLPPHPALSENSPEPQAVQNVAEVPKPNIQEAQDSVTPKVETVVPGQPQTRIEELPAKTEVDQVMTPKANTDELAQTSSPKKGSKNSNTGKNMFLGLWDGYDNTVWAFGYKNNINTKKEFPVYTGMRRVELEHPKYSVKPCRKQKYVPVFHQKPLDYFQKMLEMYVASSDGKYLQFAYTAFPTENELSKVLNCMNANEEKRAKSLLKRINIVKRALIEHKKSVQESCVILKNLFIAHEQIINDNLIAAEENITTAEKMLNLNKVLPPKEVVVQERRQSSQTSIPKAIVVPPKTPKMPKTAKIKLAPRAKIVSNVFTESFTKLDIDYKIEPKLEKLEPNASEAIVTKPVTVSINVEAPLEVPEVSSHLTSPKPAHEEVKQGTLSSAVVEKAHIFTRTRTLGSAKITYTEVSSRATSPKSALPQPIAKKFTNISDFMKSRHKERDTLLSVTGHQLSEKQEAIAAKKINDLIYSDLPVNSKTYRKPKESKKAGKTNEEKEKEDKVRNMNQVYLGKTSSSYYAIDCFRSAYTRQVTRINGPCVFISENRTD
jgi:hypothetical protein